MGFRDKDAERAYKKQWAEANREKVRAYAREQYLKNRVARIEAAKQRRLADPDRAKAYARKGYHKDVEASRGYQRTWARAARAKDPDRFREAQQKWVAANKEKLALVVNAWQRNQRRENPHYLVAGRLRCRLRKLVRTGRGRLNELLGCTPDQLRAHLEAQFQPGMSWGNADQWHIDHIRPCASFDLTDPAQQRACFHYTNLQPLWAKDNLSKGARLAAAA
jgi:hypothetical protein